MAQKKYRYTDQESGKTITFSSATVPTQDDIKQIFDLRKAHDRQRFLSKKQEREYPIQAKAGDFLSAWREGLQPKALPPGESAEDLPLGKHALRLGHEAIAGFLDPTVVIPTAATLALGAIPGVGPPLAAAARVALPGFFAATMTGGSPKLEIGAGERADLSYEPSPIVESLKMAYEDPADVARLYKGFIKDPSFAPAVQALIQGAAITGAGAGVRSGMRQFDAKPVTPPPPFRPKLGEPPLEAEFAGGGTAPRTRVRPPEDPAIDVDFTPVRPPAAQIEGAGPGIRRLEAGDQIPGARGVPAPPPSIRQTLPEQRLLTEGPTTPGIERPIVTPPPIERTGLPTAPESRQLPAARAEDVLRREKFGYRDGTEEIYFLEEGRNLPATEGTEFPGTTIQRQLPRGGKTRAEEDRISTIDSVNEGLLEEDLRPPTVEAPVASGTRSETIQKQAPFTKLADAQRNKPEVQMVKTQKLMGGGVMNVAIEHTGDLTHRMSERVTADTRGYSYVKDKVDKVLSYLQHDYGFEKEFKENIDNSAKFNNKDLIVFRSQVETALQQYANEHKVLPTFNEAQKVAQEAAIALGERRFKDAENALLTLQKHLSSKEEWIKYANGEKALEVQAPKTDADVISKLNAYLAALSPEKADALTRKLNLKVYGKEKLSAFDRWNRASQPLVDRELEKTVKASTPEVKPPGEAISETRLENEWLRNQSNIVLESMRDGASGVMRRDIDTVLGERGITPEVKAGTGRKVSEETSDKVTDLVEEGNLDTPSYNAYNGELKALLDTKTSSPGVLTKIAKLGKEAGLDVETVVQDLLDNIDPKVSNATGKARAAGARAFRKDGEAGFISLQSLFKKAENKAKDASIKELMRITSREVTELDKFLAPFRSKYTSTLNALQHMSDTGVELSRKLEKGMFLGESLKGELLLQIRNAIKDLSPEEIGYRTVVLDNGKRIVTTSKTFDKYVDWYKGDYTPKKGVLRIQHKRGSLHDVIENGARPDNAKIAQAVGPFRQPLDTLGTRGERANVSSISNEGKYIAFKKMGQDYWTRGYTDGFFKSLEKTKEWNQLIEEIAKDKGITTAEAIKLINNKKLYAELTTKGQHQRKFKRDSSMIDMDIIYDHVSSFSERIGFAEALGPKDIRGSVVRKDLIKLQNEGWNTSKVEEKIAQLVGRESLADIRLPSESKIYKGIADLNNLRLLPLFVLSNLGGITTIHARVGGLNTLKGIGAYIGNAETTKHHALLSGARNAGIIERGGALSGRVVGIPMSERFIRTWASSASTSALNGYAKHLGNLDINSSAFRRGKLLVDNLIGKDSSRNIKTGKFSSADYKRASWQLAKDSQGIWNAITAPDVWQRTADSNIWGALAMQYKRMATLGMGSLLKSLKMNPGRTISALATAGIITGELIGDSRSALIGAISGTITGEGIAIGAIRDIDNRGEALRAGLKPLLEDTFNLSEEQAKFVAVKIDNLNRGFALGLLGDFLYSLIFWGSGGISDMTSGALGPTFDFIIDILNGSKDDIIDLIEESDIVPAETFEAILPPVITSGVRRSRERMEPPRVNVPGLGLPGL
jgi:hypothetical protein